MLQNEHLLAKIGRERASESSKKPASFKRPRSDSRPAWFRNPALTNVAIFRKRQEEFHIFARQGPGIHLRKGERRLTHEQTTEDEFSRDAILCLQLKKKRRTNKKSSCGRLQVRARLTLTRSLWTTPRSLLRCFSFLQFHVLGC